MLIGSGQAMIEPCWVLGFDNDDGLGTQYLRLCIGHWEGSDAVEAGLAVSGDSAEATQFHSGYSARSTLEFLDVGGFLSRLTQGVPVKFEVLLVDTVNRSSVHGGGSK